eukprot:13106233-Alexandrium_andersonii.AAC.1
MACGREGRLWAASTRALPCRRFEVGSQGPCRTQARETHSESRRCNEHSRCPQKDSLEISRSW